MSKISDMMKGLTSLGAMDDIVKNMQEKMEAVTVEGVSAAGMVKVVIKGNYTVESVHIDDSLFADGGSVIGDLIKTALEDALGKLKEAMRENALSGLPLPDGFKLPF